jgi:hypothetical protein
MSQPSSLGSKLFPQLEWIMGLCLSRGAGSELVWQSKDWNSNLDSSSRSQTNHLKRFEAVFPC